jgi:hypothetical protein
MAGCPPDLSPWTVFDPADPPQRDGSVPPPRTDSSTPPTTGGACAAPTLLVAAHQLGDGPGRVLRYEIHGSSGLVPCGDVTAGGELDPLPFAIAPVSDRFLLVASRDRVQAVDPVDDRLLYELPVAGMHPNDAFPVDDEAWRDRVAAVAWSNTGSSASERGIIRRIETYTVEGARRNTWDASALTLGSATAMAASPREPTEALAMNSGVYSAAEIDLFGQVRREPPLVPGIMDTSTTTIASGRSSDGTQRLAWTSVADGTNAILVTDDPWGADLGLDGTTGCESECDGVHVAIDPSSSRALYAICDVDGRQRSVVWLDMDAASCLETIPAGSLGDLRPSYLAVRR